MAADAAPERLPRGRHGLSREDVVRSQRDRMLLAMAETVAEKGYAKATVADVLTRAGVSRETFYEQFSSKDDCFLETFDRAGQILLERISSDPADTGGTSFEQVLGRYLDSLASEPAFAHVFLVDVYAAGPEAVARRTAVQGQFAIAIMELFEARADHERLACELLVAGVGSMVTTKVAAGEHASLHELKEPIADLVRRALEAR